MAKREKKYCIWCGGETKNPPTLISKIPLIDLMEEHIDIFGRERILDDYYEGEIQAPPQIRAELYAYLDLLNDVKERIICDPCLEEEFKNNDKYYSSLIQDDEDLINFINGLVDKDDNNIGK